MRREVRGKKRYPRDETTRPRDKAVAIARLLLYVAEEARESSGAVCEMHINNAIEQLMRQFDISVFELWNAEDYFSPRS